MTKAPRSRLGWLGPAIVLVGATVAGAAIWFMQTHKPEAGAEIDRIAMTQGRSIVVRHEAHSERSMIELRDGNEIKWQALIPHYVGEAGRPGVAWSEKAVTVRVTREGRAEVFAFAVENAQKLGAYRLAPEREPIQTQTTGPITLTDHVHAYEIVGGVDWHQLIAVDLLRGGGVWKADLGRDPITAGGIEGKAIWLEQAGKRRWFATDSGREAPDGNSLK